MRVNLKSGEYYDYYDIKRVEIRDSNLITVKGSLEKGKKSRIATNTIGSIKNIRELNRFLRKEMKEFHADGICPHCESLNVVEQGQAIYSKKLNDPKARTKYEPSILGNYKCNACRKLFSELKYVDLVIYYK